MKIRTVEGFGMWRVAAGRRDPFLHRRRIKWDQIVGWIVLLGSGIAWGIIAAELMIDTWGK